MITVSRALFLLRARARAFIKHVRYDVSVRDFVPTCGGAMDCIFFSCAGVVFLDVSSAHTYP